MIENTLMRSLLIGLPLLMAGICHAQDGELQRYTAVELDAVDADFRYSGEYQGRVKTSENAAATMGLQVVALGAGKFGGMSYVGGLPGTGWNRQERSTVAGQSNGALVTLEDDHHRYEMVNDSIMVFSKDGAIVGELPKVLRRSATLGMPAPPNAYTLFDGQDTRQFKNGQVTEEGLLKEGTELIRKFRDFTMHVEYRLPYMPYARGQGRSNSGIYLQSSYEVQVLDSFGLEGVENECGALYRYKRPDLNMCLPPLRWQTYDITFRSPRFDAEGKKIRNARLTVLHNGVAVHDDFEVERKTGAGQPEADVLRPIKLQDHSNPVRFRNIWLIDLEAANRCNFY